MEMAEKSSAVHIHRFLLLSSFVSFSPYEVQEQNALKARLDHTKLNSKTFTYV